MKRIFLWIVLCSAVVSASGQVKNLSLQLENILFTDLIDTLERVVPARFYYSDKWVDSLKLSLNASDIPFNKIVERTLSGSGLSFFITEDDRVILSKGYSVKTGFGDEYLDYLRRNIRSQDTLLRQGLPSEKADSEINDESRIFIIGRQSESGRGMTAALSGTIISKYDGEPVPGAIIYIGKLRAGAMTNEAGYYSITLPRGQYQIEYRMMGMKTTRRNVIVYSDGILDVGMDEDQNLMEAVIITATRDNIKDVRTGTELINVKMLRQIPMGLGEADIIKSSLLLPGVQTVGEASAGFNVRGGSTDQNLVLLDYAPVINTSHMFGFFSAFNPDLVTDVTLYKSGMPAKYGGRLSSVMVINPSVGSREKVNVSGGISPVTGRILVEGPISDEKTSFIIGARSTYSDWLLGFVDDYRIRNSNAGFYDLQGSISHIFDEKNSLSLSAYYSQDRFNYYLESSFRYGNLATTLKWDHLFGPDLSARFCAILSDYKYQVDIYNDSTTYSSLNYKLGQKLVRGDFNYSAFEKHKIEFGIDATFFSLYPGTREPFGDYSTVPPKELEKEQAIEPSLYFGDEIEITPLLSLYAGLRGTLFTSFGPGTEFQYSYDDRRTVDNITDTVRFGSGEVMSFYPGLDFRFSARYILTTQSSIKLSAQRVYQYIHMISNTTSISPTDIWKISNKYLEPERSDQVSAGIYYNLKKSGIGLSAEGYYKILDNMLDYKGGAILIMNEHLETDIMNSYGKAYGVELMIRKQTGSLTGWIGYTWSRTLLSAAGGQAEEGVTTEEYFPADFDKPHDLKVVTNLKITRRFNFTSNFNYSTGRPITFPVAFFNFDNANQIYYSSRNSYRMPDYIRLDLAVTINGTLKARKLNHSSLTLSAYNVFGRKNPYSVYFRYEDGRIRGYQLTIFGQPVIMLSYNFRIFGNASGDF